MTGTMRRGKYTLEFKEESVRQVLSGGSIASVAASLGIPKASLSNWVRQQRRGQLGGGDNAVSSAPVSAEQMEIYWRNTLLFPRLPTASHVNPRFEPEEITIC